MTKKATGLREFKEMPEEQQLDLLHMHGVYVGKRKTGKLILVLFQLYGFYVEVFYKHYRKTIDHIIISDSADILQPYIDQVDVRDLNKNDNKEEGAA